MCFATCSFGSCDLVENSGVVAGQKSVAVQNDIDFVGTVSNGAANLFEFSSQGILSAWKSGGDRRHVDRRMLAKEPAGKPDHVGVDANSGAMGRAIFGFGWTQGLAAEVRHFAGG